MKIFRWIKLLILFYALLGIGIYYLQDYFLFHPEALQRRQALNIAEPHREVNIPVNREENLNIVQFPADTSQGPCRGIVLYFHGNRKNITWYAKYAPAFTRHGYEVWMADYPGFGKTTGTLTEAKLYADAGLVYQLARTRFGADSILLYGKSMGTGIAAELASRKPAAALVLETPYYSLRSLAQRYFFFYPLKKMLHYEIPTYDFLPKVAAPILILQGTDDGVVPYSNAAKLKPLLKSGDRFISIEGGSHNDLSSYPAYRTALDSVLTR